ncbi:MAG: glucosaminidase domain-containing protein [Gammaproteobacteria bacterium]
MRTRKILKLFNVIIAALLVASLIISCSSPDDVDISVSQAEKNAYSAITGGEPDPELIIINSYKEALDLFAQHNYTPEAWQSGIRVVPRIYLGKISDQWSKVTTREIDVQLKKRLFFRAIGPLALRSNELIMLDRTQLESIKASANYSANQSWLMQMAEQYRIKDSTDLKALTTELLLRVDIIPPSLVLAQAAEESGWGTSRFAFQGNALFGQWTWGDKGIRPEQQRGQKGDYKIAVFDSPLQSVQAHALNLNSHHAYEEFRRGRKELRQQGNQVRGLSLTPYLESYSERGPEYVKSLNSIINFNELDPADDAILGNNRAVVMIRSE